MATRYWVGGSGTWDASSTTHWSATSGGAAGASAPTSSDDVIFNSASSGASYVVSMIFSGVVCNNITTTAPAVGTLSIDNQAGVGYGITAYGSTINFHATCNFPSIIDITTNSNAATVNFTFNSSGTLTSLVRATVNNTFSGGVINFCVGHTQTFQQIAVYGAFINPGTINCTSATLTVSSSYSAFGGTDSVTFFANTAVNLTNTTLNMGSVAGSWGANTSAVVSILYGTNTYTGFIYNEVRSYTTHNLGFTNTGTGAKYTLKGENSTSGIQALNVINCSGGLTASNFSESNPLSVWGGSGGGGVTTPVVIGAITLSGAWVTIGPQLSGYSLPTSITTGAITLNDGTSAGSGLYLESTTVNINGNVLLSGTTYGQLLGMDCIFAYYCISTITGTLTSTAPVGVKNIIKVSRDAYPTTVTGNTSITNTIICTNESSSDPICYANWIQSGASTFTSTSNPTSVVGSFGFGGTGSFITVGSITMGTGAASFTSTNIELNGVGAAGKSLNSGGLVTVNGSGVSTGTTFTYYSGVSFVAATLATWTDVLIQNPNNNSDTFAVTGALGFTLAGATKNSGISAQYTRFACTGPMTLNLGSVGTPAAYVDSIAASGTFTITSPAATTGVLFLNAAQGLTSTFTGAASFTRTSFASYGSSTFSSTFTWVQTTGATGSISASGTTTFTGVASITDPFSLQFGIVVAGANFTINSTNTRIDQVVLTSYTNANAAATTSLTNIGISSTQGWNISGNLSLFKNTNLGLSTSGSSSPSSTVGGTLTTDSATGTFYSIEGAAGSTLALNGAVTLVNCMLRVPTITVAGGASKAFAYSLTSSVVPDTRQNVSYGLATLNNYSYPEIAFDSFTLTNTGSTFSIAGGGAVNLRTLVRPFSNTTTAATMNLAVNPTFTDVDFWRITPGGASTKPWTGTRLGNVGTLTNITTSAPKNVYFVGGAGSWGAAKWATSSGGTGAVANYPLPQDSINFDSNSGTGDITLPASVRFKDFSVLNVAAGTVTINTSNVTSYQGTFMLMSGSFYGPAFAPAGTFIFGNNSSYSSYYVSSPNTYGELGMILIAADSSAADTHTIATQNIEFMPRQALQFANLGSLNVTKNLVNSSGYYLYSIKSYFQDSRTISFSCDQVGPNTAISSHFSGYNTTYSFDYGTFNLGSCSFGAQSIGSLTTATVQDTAYTIYFGNVVSMTNNTNPNAGNLVAVVLSGSQNIIQPNATSNNYYKNFSVIADIAGRNADVVIQTPGSSLGFYDFSIAGAGLSSFVMRGASASVVDLVKLGGGFVSLPSAQIAPNYSGIAINASPANSWYAPGGTVQSGSTGWSTATRSTNTGGFLTF